MRGASLSDTGLHVCRYGSDKHHIKVARGREIISGLWYKRYIWTNKSDLIFGAYFHAQGNSHDGEIGSVWLWKWRVWTGAGNRGEKKLLYWKPWFKKHRQGSKPICSCRCIVYNTPGTILCEVDREIVTGGFPSQRPVTLSFYVFFDLHLNKRLSKQSGRRWFETPSRSLWRHWIDVIEVGRSHLTTRYSPITYDYHWFLEISFVLGISPTEISSVSDSYKWVMKNKSYFVYYCDATICLLDQFLIVVMRLVSVG